MIDKGDRILVVCAHSDDEALGCSGSISKWSEIADEVAIIFLTNGVSSRLDARKEAHAIRYEEQIQSLALIGVTQFRNFDFPDNGLDGIPLLELAQNIEKEISNFKPTVILTHSLADLNVDHRKCCEAVLVATRPQAHSKIRLVASFEVLSSTEWFYTNGNSFQPNLYVDITETMELKLQACRCYASEMREPPNARSIQNVRHLAALRGATVGVSYAESFEVMRLIV